MLLIHKIEKVHFSQSESMIIQYILESGDKIKNMSVQQIADATYTSPSLLIRIAKKLGYVGWNALKEDYLKELEYLYSSSDIDASIPFVVTDDFMTIANHISRLQIETIEDTMSLLNHDDLSKALRLIRKCDQIDMYGVSQNILYAQEFAHKMYLIHKKVHICHLMGDGKIQASMSNDKICAILISYSGQTNFILEIAYILKNQGTPIIALTSIADNELSKIADVTLRISSREMLHTKIGDFSTSQSIKVILDILYACIFSFDYQKNLDDKIEIAKKIDDKISGFEYIDEK